MRIVDIDRIEASPLEADEAWVVEASSRRGSEPSRSSIEPPAPDAAPARGVRPQLVVRPGPLAELAQQVEAHLATGGPGAVRLCPGPDEDDYPLEPWVLSPLPEYCASRDITMIVDPGPRPARYPWDEIVRLAREYPRLVIVALAAPLEGPTAQKALDASQNLVLETSALTGTTRRDLARLVEVAGPHRFVYGSGDRGVVASVVKSCLSPEAALAVLGGNAELMDRGAWGAAFL